MAAINEGKTPSKTLRMKAYDFLKATNRVTDGRGYDALRSALIRLQGTQIETNIVTGETEQLDIFSIIDRAKIVRQTRDGRMQEIEVQLSDWVFNAIRAKEVLTFHRDYFRLRKPIERRLYELARKHCGQKREWRITLPVLQRKCGSSSTLREFRRLIQNIVEHDKEHAHIPDYGVQLDEDMVIFSNRGTMLEDQQTTGIPSFASVRLGPDTLAKAREAAPGWDVYVLESEWRSWMADGGLDAPKNPDKAFLGFCKKWFERRGRP